MEGSRLFLVIILSSEKFSEFVLYLVLITLLRLI